MQRIPELICQTLRGGRTRLNKVKTHGRNAGSEELRGVSYCEDNPVCYTVIAPKHSQTQHHAWNECPPLPD